MSVRIGCIVLAAGRSRRFGRTRRNKLLAALGNTRVIECVLQAVAASAVGPTVVVTGHQQHAVRAIAQPRRGRRWPCRYNRHHRQGMARSLQAGLLALPAGLDGVVVCLGDMPGVRHDVIDALLAAFTRGDDAVLPVCDGRRGNPVLLARSLFPALMMLTGDQGARRILAQPGWTLRYVTTDNSVLHDIDRRRDWLRAQRRPPRRRASTLRRHGPPTYDDPAQSL